MNYTNAVSEFEGNLPGTDSFLAVKQNMLALISSEPAHAAAFFQIYVHARNYVILHDDEAITADYAQRSKAQLLDYMKAIEAAIPLSAAALLEAMNQNIIHYLASDRPF